MGICVATPLSPQGRTLTTAWVGDSRGVLGRRSEGGTSWEAVDLTVDHKPTSPEEKSRILRSNGRVERCARLGGWVGGWVGA
jgi:serine/threonine protein phosphatase PrpC